MWMADPRSGVQAFALHPIGHAMGHDFGNAERSENS
jgi:hypothetical protein